MKLLMMLGFEDRLPQGELFAGQDRESFVDSMIVLLTIVKKFHGQQALSNWDTKLTDIIDTYYVNVTNLMREMAEDEGMSLEEDKDYLVTLITDKDAVEEIDAQMSDALGIQNELNELYNTLNDLVGELGDRIVSVVTQLVEKIGNDNAGQYIRARHKLKTVRVPVISHLAAIKSEGGFGLLVWKYPKTFNDGKTVWAYVEGSVGKYEHPSKKNKEGSPLTASIKEIREFAKKEEEE
jgi:hypothetical protein